MLDRAGAALAAERDLTGGCRAGRRRASRPGSGSPTRELLDEVLAPVRPAYGDVRVGLVSAGQLTVDGRRYDPDALAGRAARDGRRRGRTR